MMFISICVKGAEYSSCQIHLGKLRIDVKLKARLRSINQRLENERDTYKSQSDLQVNRILRASQIEQEAMCKLDQSYKGNNYSKNHI